MNEVSLNSETTSSPLRIQALTQQEYDNTIVEKIEELITVDNIKYRECDIIGFYESQISRESGCPDLNDILYCIEEDNFIVITHIVNFMWENRKYNYDSFINCADFEGDDYDEYVDFVEQYLVDTYIDEEIYLKKELGDFFRNRRMSYTDICFFPDQRERFYLNDCQNILFQEWILEMYFYANKEYDYLSYLEYDDILSACMFARKEGM